MKNKFLAIILVFAMLLSGLFTFASCNSSDDIADTIENTDNENPPEEPEEDKVDDESPEGEDNEAPSPELDLTIEMITYNIAYYEASSDSMTVYYEGQTIDDYKIAKRAERLASFVEHFTPDVLALQEVNRLWWPYIISDDNSIVKTCGYDWAGNIGALRGKDGSGSSDSELYNLLLWNSERFEEIDSGVFRYNQRPKGDANVDRLCTYAILKDRTTGAEILYASTHLCTRSDMSRDELNVLQATMFMEELIRLAEGRTIVVGGDFNADTPSNTYRYMTETAGFCDTRITAKYNATPDMCSARVWGGEKNWNNGMRTPIDHIFYLGNGVAVEEWTVLTETYDKDNKVTTDINMIGKNFDLSDHQGIYVKFKENISQ